MIDFPNSPTDGQVFSATNGVVYRWSAATGAWLAQTGPPVLGGTGQVTAISTVVTALVASTDVVIPFATVQSGNAGLWWNTATNRYTPPAGLYFISANIAMNNGSGGNATATLKIRKNGTAIGAPLNVSMSSGFWGGNAVGQYVDANGTDFFDVVVNLLASSAATSVLDAIFSAFPLSGIQGPTGGPPGPVVGDFAAAGNPAIGTTPAAMIMPVVNGNSGGYYNATTGRWTPPAGRYNIYGVVGAWSSAGGIGISVSFRKNGVAIPSVAVSVNTPGANQWGAAPLETQVDANGTDYFDFWASTSPGATGSEGYFGAFPTQGLVGPQGPAGPAGGGPPNSDFYATNNATVNFTGAGTVLPFQSVLSGNLGGYYSTTTNRFTPPAGRFYIFAGVTPFNSGGTGGSQILNLRKNGVIVAPQSSQSAPSGAQVSLTIQATVDANGTDFFDIFGTTGASSGTVTANQMWFGAFPTQGAPGVQGPAGPAGGGPPNSDFYATTGNVSQVASATAAIVQIGTVVSGNLGAYYSPTTWRWTPPAGRYLFYGWCCLQAGGAGANTQQLQLTKNGVIIPNTSAQAYGAVGNATTTITLQATVDANGTDVFDMRVQSLTTNGTVIGAGVGGTPTQGLPGPPGIQGPPGPSSATGDFFGIGTALSLANNWSITAIGICSTIISGNASSWYNTTTGVYTPPAGRYLLYGWATGTIATASASMQCAFFKNGVVINPNLSMVSSPPSTTAPVGISLEVTIDANGTDTFDFRVRSSTTGGGTATSFGFGAVPLGAQGAQGPPGVPGTVVRNQMSGYVHSSAGGTQSLTIGAGQCSDSANAVQINLMSPMTKQCQAGWTAGNNGGGAGTVVLVGPNQWYFPFAIIVNGQPDWYLDSTAAGSAVNRPTGTTAWRRLRPIRTDASGNFLAHTGKGDLVQWVTVITETPTVSPITLNGVPPGIQTFWQGRVFLTGTGGWGIDYFTPGGVGNAGSVFAASNTGNQGSGGTMSVLTNTAQQIATIQGGTFTNSFLSTWGFIDDCGRYD